MLKVLLKLALFAITFSLIAEPTNAQKSYTFGIVPQQAASKLARLWSPILKHVSEQSGYRLIFRTAKNIPTFEGQLAKSAYDFAYVNPYHFTVFNVSPGYKAFARQSGKRIKGIIIVRKDSTVLKLKELAGKTLAFPAPAAFAASVLPRAHLSQIKVLIIPKYVSSHDSVYRAVAKGLYPAGGGIERTLANLDPTIRRQLKILWRTDGFTPHAFVYHPKLALDVRDKIVAAFLAMNDSDVGRRLLSQIKFKGLQKSYDNDWNDVKGLGINLLKHLIEGKSK